MSAASAVLDPAARTARRLGILGGSFDPPHTGHLHAAKSAARAFDLDHVVFVPAARPPHKPNRVLADAAGRLAMLELLLQPEIGVSVWAGELERDGPSYSIDTARWFTAEVDGELFWILGGDNLPGFPRWREAEALIALAHPIVIFREGDELLAEVPGLSEGAAARIEAGLCRVPPVEASSSELRRRLAAGLDPGPSLPTALREYIERRGIYPAA